MGGSKLPACCTGAGGAATWPGCYACCACSQGWWPAARCCSSASCCLRSAAAKSPAKAPLSASSSELLGRREAAENENEPASGSLPWLPCSAGGPNADTLLSAFAAAIDAAMFGPGTSSECWLSAAASTHCSGSLPPLPCHHLPKLEPLAAACLPRLARALRHPWLPLPLVGRQTSLSNSPLLAAAWRPVVHGAALQAQRGGESAMLEPRWACNKPGQAAGDQSRRTTKQPHLPQGGPLLCWALRCCRTAAAGLGRLPPSHCSSTPADGTGMWGSQAVAAGATCGLERCCRFTLLLQLFPGRSSSCCCRRCLRRGWRPPQPACHRRCRPRCRRWLCG